MPNQENYIIAQVEDFICPITIIASVRGVRGIHFTSLDAIIEKLTQENIPHIIDLSHPAAIELREYFQGHRKHFDVPIDIDGTPFQLKVWKALQSIPYGKVRSYKDIAIQIGHPKAFRAVGQACGANPIPIIIPCHRVLTASGNLGGFSAGIEIKKALLDLEGISHNKYR
ncbi:MAG: methylated-DNA--[protein]-cysteine S-methyltransferase [Caldicoprobacter oshimai]|uniref:Methylated-DNA--protein-cysteine methyltransferase n=1 Tax=Caldicoprobacter faecalis TaxID=937334 RepID=A0A1I5SRL7_9FIRM|nr:methylated-DNA--[protein]-cysteine S-methyltransferase [Caldicoprobacter faecalis]PZN09972.1 MAG: methylated-DNA--[protein]-cysteine S-methyltransferase [Caldicoprobacter oshimai]SFP73281.1 methylated-DNA-[protein]-cysteine S-methyltransferase [Caldicoprobacter faecalis]